MRPTVDTPSGNSAFFPARLAAIGAEIFDGGVFNVNGKPAPHPLSPLMSNLSLHGAVLLFGLAALFAKWVPAHPVVIVFARVLVASVCFVPLLRWLPRERAPLSLRERSALVACGGLLAFHWFAFFHAIQLSTVAIGLLAYSTAPVFTSLLEPLLSRERFSWRTVACAALTMVGVALIIPRWSLGEAITNGILWGVLAGFSFALLSLANRQLVQRHSSLRIAFYQDLSAMVLLAPLTALVWQPLKGGELALLVVLGIFCTALAHTLFIQALHGITASVAAITSALEPVYGIALAWLLLEEHPESQVLIGGAIILLAVIWASRPQAEPIGAP